MNNQLEALTSILNDFLPYSSKDIKFEYQQDYLFIDFGELNQKEINAGKDTIKGFYGLNFTIDEYDICISYKNKDGEWSRQTQELSQFLNKNLLY